MANRYPTGYPRGLTGSLQEASPGIPYIQVVGLITATTQSNGSILLNGFGDVSASYIVFNNTSSLPNERSLSAGTGITIIDNGPGSTVTISTTAEAGEVSASYLVLNFTSSLVNERMFAVGAGLSSSDGGSNGIFQVSAPFVSASYLTLNNESLLPNERAITVGPGLSMSDGGAGGALTIDIVGSLGEVSASYLVLNTTSSLANERVFTVGTGLSSSDGGANGNFTVSVDFSVVGNVTGSAPTVDNAIATWSGSLGRKLNNTNITISGTTIQAPNDTLYVGGPVGSTSPFGANIIQYVPGVITASFVTASNGAFHRISTLTAPDEIGLQNPNVSAGQSVSMVAISSSMFLLTSPGGNINNVLGTIGIGVTASVNEQFTAKCDGINWWVARFTGI